MRGRRGGQRTKVVNAVVTERDSKIDEEEGDKQKNVTIKKMREKMWMKDETHQLFFPWSYLHKTHQITSHE